MKVKELIKKLEKFNPEWEVFISDGALGIYYNGDFSVREFDDTVDIGIDGYEVKEED